MVQYSSDSNYYFCDETAQPQMLHLMTSWLGLYSIFLSLFDFQQPFHKDFIA